MKLTRRQLRKMILNEMYNMSRSQMRNEKINVFTISKDNMTYFLDAVELNPEDVRFINQTAEDPQLLGALNMVTVAQIARDKHGAEYILDQNFEDDWESGLAGVALKVEQYIQVQKDALLRHNET